MAQIEVTNDALNQVLVMTDHAVERWNERCSGDLSEALKAAVPFGAQYDTNGSLLMRSSEAVFVTHVIRKNKRLVVTVLTIEQAVANMQAVKLPGGFRFNDSVKAKYVKRIDMKGLGQLAAYHAVAGYTKGQRLQALENLGLDVNSQGADRYRCAYEAAIGVIDALRQGCVKPSGVVVEG